MLKRLRKVEPDMVYMGIEYIIAVYAIFSTVVNLLNMMEIHFCSQLLKPTFWGSSLLVLFLLQYGLILPNRKNEILKKIRPYIMGTLAAGIVSTCHFPLCFVLLLLLGYFLLNGFQKKYSPQEAALLALATCIGMEIYSIISLLQENSVENIVGMFLQSVGPDILFVLSAIAYGAVIDRSPKTEAVETEAEEMTPETNEDNEGEEPLSDFSENKKKKHHHRRSSQMAYKILTKWEGAQKKISANSIRIAHFAGGALCVISIGLFFYYALSVGISAKKIESYNEDLYVLKNCEDTSLVLTSMKTEDPAIYNITFEKYEGKNNQKVFFRETGDNTCQVIFLESGYALEVTENYGLYATPIKNSASQEWRMETYRGEVMTYRFLDMQGTPLCYSLLSNGNGVSVISVGSNSGGAEYFVPEGTIGDEFATCMVARYYTEFTPTILLETILTLLGRWVWLFFILVVLVIFFIIYLRRIIGDKLAALYGMLFLYMLAYESVSSILLLCIAFGIQYYYAYICKKKKTNK